MENCLSSGNAEGIVSANSFVRVSGSTLVENTYAAVFTYPGGGVYSRGNNMVEGNAGFESFTGTFAPK